MRRFQGEAFREQVPGMGRPAAAALAALPQLAGSYFKILPISPRHAQMLVPRTINGGGWIMRGKVTASEADGDWSLAVTAATEMTLPVRYNHQSAPTSLPLVMTSIVGVKWDGKCADYDVEVVNENGLGFDLIIRSGEGCRLRRIAVTWDARVN